MTVDPDKIVELRTLLAVRFPEAATAAVGYSASAASLLSTGVSVFDAILGGGLARGTLTEVVRASTGSGAACLVAALVAASAEEHTGRCLALVDGTDALDATALYPAALARLLWVRCHGDPNRLLRATELLCRDGNLPLVIADATDLPVTALRQFGPPTVWYRLQRVLEQTGTTCLVFTPQTLLGAAAHTRLRLAGSYSFNALESEAEDILAALDLQLERQRPVVPNHAAAGDAASAPPTRQTA